MKMVFWAHAVKRLFEREISIDEMQAVIVEGETIEDYPYDEPYPSKLVLGWMHGRPLHVVAAFNEDTNETIGVTVYEPDPDIWDPDFRTKK